MEVKLRCTPHHCYVITLPSKTRTTFKIEATFPMYIVQRYKLYSKQFHAYLFTAMLCDNTITSYCAYA